MTEQQTSASHCLLSKIGKQRLGGARPLSRAGGRFWSWLRTGRARKKMRCWRRAQVRCGGAQPMGQQPRVRPALGVTAGDVTGHSPGGLHQGRVPCQVPRPGDRVTVAGGRWWETRGPIVVTHRYRPQSCTHSRPAELHTHQPHPDRQRLTSSLMTLGPDLSLTRTSTQLWMKWGSAAVRVDSIQCAGGARSGRIRWG